MPQVLQLAHFGQYHGVAQVDVGRGGIQPQFDAQWLACGLGTHEFFLPVILRDQFIAAAQRHGQCVLYGLAGGGVGGNGRSRGRSRHGQKIIQKTALAAKQKSLSLLHSV